MAINVKRESETTKSRFVTPTYIDEDGNQVVGGSEKPLPVIQTNHLRLHEGRAYHTYVLYPEANKLDAGASIDIAIAWPSGINAHTTFHFQLDGSGEFYMYEGASTSGGSAMTLHKRNRTSTTASAGAAVLNPTVSAVGTEMYAEFVASGAGGNTTTGDIETREFILKPLTTYLIRLTNSGSQAGAAELIIDWYE